MATLELTQDNFNETISSDGIVVVDFWASWCGPCLRFGPTFEKVSNENPDAIFGKVDTEAQPELSAAFNIQSIPTLMIARDGVVVYSQPGAIPEDALVDLLKQVSELDMDQVRAELSQQTSSEK